MPIPTACRVRLRLIYRTLGISKGDRVAVMLPNLPAFPLAMLGIIRAGAIQVNVNPLHTARELEHQLNDAGAKAIVIFTGVSPTLAEIISHTGVERIISVNLSDGIAAALPSPPLDTRLANFTAFTDALAQGADLPLKSPALSGADILFLQYTGCTTGLSKGAALSHRNLVANTEQFKAFHARRATSGPGDRGHGAAALLYLYLRADGELHHRFLDRRREFSSAQSARIGGLRGNAQAGAPDRFHRREQAVQRAVDAAEHPRGRLLQSSGRDRRRRRRATDDVAGRPSLLLKMASPRRYKDPDLSAARKRYRLEQPALTRVADAADTGDATISLYPSRAQRLHPGKLIFDAPVMTIDDGHFSCWPAQRNRRG
jgi:AMP-binding enzyme